jgi:hypothetical protein
MSFTSSNIAVIEAAIRQFLVECDQHSLAGDALYGIDSSQSRAFVLFTDNCRASEITVKFKTIAVATKKDQKEDAGRILWQVEAESELDKICKAE